MLVWGFNELMYLKVLRKLWTIIKCTVFFSLELEHVQLWKYAVSKQVWPRAYCPSEKKPTAWLPLLKHKAQVCTRGLSPRQGQSRALAIPKASVGFSRGGISKNKTWGLTKTRGVLSWRWFTMWVSQQFRSPVWYEQRTSKSSSAWPKLYRTAGKEPSLAGLRVGGIFCESRGMDLCLQHAVLQKEIGSGLTEAQDLSQYMFQISWREMKCTVISHRLFSGETEN